MGKKRDIKDDKNVKVLVQNYEKMDDTGKEKLKEISEQVLKIYSTVKKKP